MQTILATGATGLIGSRFVEMFRDKYDVVNGLDHGCRYHERRHLYTIF
jgi:nucleoside-diphosphate-sugar epimerase